MKILAQFKSVPNYVDFCLPELKSLLEMFELDWKEVFKHEFVEEGEEEAEINIDNYEDLSRYYAQGPNWIKNPRKKKLALPKRLCEIRHTSFRRFPFIYLEFPSCEIAQQLIQRSILLDVFIEILSEAPNYKDLVSNVNKPLLSLHNNPEFKILFEVDPYNSHFTQKEIIDRIEILTESLDMKGKIDLKNPQKKFWVMERHIHPYIRQTDYSIMTSLLDIFFGVEVGRSKSNSRMSQKENYFYKFDLKNRVYLGPTSTENTLSFLMCNQGQAKQGSFVLDPFVGSGSLLIPPSLYGAICTGGDIDPRVLHGYGVGRINKKSTFYKNNSELCEEMKPKIMLNFEQYDLPKPTIIRMDCINSSLRITEIFDSIICDPPYGQRAMTRTSAKKVKKICPKDRQSTSATQEDEGFDENEENHQDDKQQIATKALQEVIEEMASQAQKIKTIQGQVGEVDKLEVDVLPTEEKQSNKNEKEESSENVLAQKTQEKDETLNQKSNEQEQANKAGEGYEEDEESKEEVKKPFKQWPSKMLQVTVDQIINGLVSFANKFLIPGGKLVFLYPLDKDQYSESEFSKQSFPNFTLLDYSENSMTESKSRILITLRKEKPYSEFLKINQTKDSNPNQETLNE